MVKNDHGRNVSGKFISTDDGQKYKETFKWADAEVRAGVPWLIQSGGQARIIVVLRLLSVRREAESAKRLPLETVKIYSDSFLLKELH